MSNNEKFYINGEWVEPRGGETIEVINPATEEAVGMIRLGNHDDVDAAVAAAQEAFHSFSQTSVEERMDLLNKITEIIGARSGDLAAAITSEMGAPNGLSKAAQAGTGLAHFATMAAVHTSSDALFFSACSAYAVINGCRRRNPRAQEARGSIASDLALALS